MSAAKYRRVVLFSLLGFQSLSNCSLLSCISAASVKLIIKSFVIPSICVTLGFNNSTIFRPLLRLDYESLMTLVVSFLVCICSKDTNCCWFTNNVQLVYWFIDVLVQTCACCFIHVYIKTWMLWLLLNTVCVCVCHLHSLISTSPPSNTAHHSPTPSRPSHRGPRNGTHPWSLKGSSVTLDSVGRKQSHAEG